MISWFRVSINILPLFIFVRFLANSFLSPEQTYFLKKWAFVIISLWTKVARIGVADSKFYNSSNVSVFCDVLVWYGIEFQVFVKILFKLSLTICSRFFQSIFRLSGYFWWTTILVKYLWTFSRLSLISFQYKWIGTNCFTSCRTT